MKYVQYFEMFNNKLVEACGDRAVVIIDGRYRVSRCHEEARELNGFRRPHYDAYQIWEGESLLRSKPISDIFNLK